MGTVAVIGLLLAAGFALGGGRGSSRSGSRRMPEDQPLELCSFTATRAAGLSESQRFAWLECDGRTAEDAAALVVRLRRTDNAAATRAENRWNAIRSVVEAQPDGQLESAQARADAERVERGETIAEDSPRGRMTMGEVSIIRTTDARRLTGPVVRALRARRNYRQSLIEFQRAAGILADGRFGPQSYNALRYFGGDPPMPFVRGDINSPANQYPPGGVPFEGGEVDSRPTYPRADDSFAGSSGRMSRA